MKIKRCLTLFLAFLACLLVPGCGKDAVASSQDRAAPITPAWTEPMARMISPSACDKRRLSLPSEVSAWAQNGYHLWHLCYRTPTPATSMHRLASERPQIVTTSFFHEPSQSRRDIISVSAPLMANPWVMNVLVALPLGARPFFFIENEYPSTERLGAASELRPHGDILTHGTWQMWRVSEDGRQEALVPNLNIVCGYTNLLRHDEPRQLFFIPHLDYLRGFESYPRGAYRCRDQLASPL